MTNEQIIKKAIENAIENGYPKDPSFDKWDWKYVYENGGYLEIIFDHDFAKAFWNKEDIYYHLSCNKCNATYNYFSPKTLKYCSGCGTKLTKEEEYRDYAWKRHLENMVLEKEPLLYLKKFL